MSQINWGSVADWVSGIGTLAAAGVALYLSRWNERIRLQGYCGLRVAIGGGTPKQELVFVSVTNIGTRPTVIQLIGMRVGRFKRRQAVISLKQSQYSVGIPHQLGDGQQAQWGVPLDDQRTWLRELCDGFVMKNSDIQTLRIQVHTTHGHTLNIQPEEPLRKALLEFLRERVNKASA